MTTFRHNVFDDRHLTRMEEITRAVCADFDTELVGFNGANNHLHPLVTLPPKIALAKPVNTLKEVSSRRMRQEFPNLDRHYHRANRLWPGTYFAGSLGGAPLSVLRQYIDQHNRPVQDIARALAALPTPAFTPTPKGRSAGPHPSGSGRMANAAALRGVTSFARRLVPDVDGRHGWRSVEGLTLLLA